MRLALAATIIAGCGRIDFDPIGGGGVAVCTPAAERCNGIDDNCDGVIDEGCACTPFDITLTTPPEVATVAWTGTGYLALIEAGTDALVARVGEDGMLGASGVLLPGASGTVHGRFAWSGAALAAFWAGQSPALEVTRFDANATVLGGPIGLGTNRGGEAVAWTGDRFVVAWTDTTASPPVCYLRELGGDTQPITGETAIDGVSAFVQALALAAGGYMIVTDNPLTGDSPHAQLVDRTGVVLASHDIAPGVTNPFALGIAGGPAGFGVMWVTSSDVTFRALAGDGAPSGAGVVLPRTDVNGYVTAAIAVQGEHYEIVAVTAGQHELVYVDIDAAGTILAGPTMFAPFGAIEFTDIQLITADHREMFSASLPTTGMLRMVQQCR